MVNGDPDFLEKQRKAARGFCLFYFPAVVGLIEISNAMNDFSQGRPFNWTNFAGMCGLLAGNLVLYAISIAVLKSVEDRFSDRRPK